MNQEPNETNKMKRYQITIIVVAALVVIAVAAFFLIRGTQQEEDILTLQSVDTGNATAEITDAVPATDFQINADDVVANVNGKPVTGSDVQTSYQHVVNFYGEPDAESTELYYSVAMEEAITLNLIQQTAAELGVDQFTQEEMDELNASADNEWQYALDNYVSYNLEETDETTDADRTAAYAEAEAYYNTMGYSQDVLRENYLEDKMFERVKAVLCKDVTVTDDEVMTYYNDAVASDKDTYEFDVDAYENQVMMYQYGYADQKPWFHPDGYRYIKQILLPVDEDMMTNYTDLLARYEEQMDDEEAGTDADADTAETPVTAEDIDAAKAEIIASVQAQVDEINDKLAQGASFDDLIAEYGSDPGMTSGDYPDGYEVSLASYGYVTDFISASFSVDEIGAVSEPFLSEYGVHIIKYVGDVPAGPVELTDDLKALIHDNLYNDKSNAVLSDWHAAADIEYTGIIRSVEEIQAAEADTDEAE